MDRFPPRPITSYTNGAWSEVMSRIPTVVDYCWSWLLHDDPVFGSKFRRIFVPCHFGYADDHPDWTVLADKDILQDFHEIRQMLSLNLVEHSNPGIAAFVQNRSQRVQPTINFTPFYHTIMEELATAITSGEGRLSQDCAILSFDQLVVAVIITFFHELGHLYLRWKHPLKHTPERVYGHDFSVRKPGRGEGGENVEDMLAGGLVFVTRQTGLLCYRLISFQTYHSPNQRWLSLKPEKATVIVDNLVTQDLTTIPFFRETTATPINPLFGKDSPIIRSLSNHPPIGPDPRQPPTSSIVTPASPLDKYGTLPSSDSFTSLFAGPLVQPLFWTANANEEPNHTAVEFIGFALGMQRTCLIDLQDDWEAPLVPAEDTVILETIVQC